MTDRLNIREAEERARESIDSWGNDPNVPDVLVAQDYLALAAAYREMSEAYAFEAEQALQFEAKLNDLEAAYREAVEALEQIKQHAENHGKDGRPHAGCEKWTAAVADAVLARARAAGGVECDQCRGTTISHDRCLADFDHAVLAKARAALQDPSPGGRRPTLRTDGVTGVDPESPALGEKEQPKPALPLGHEFVHDCLRHPWAKHCDKTLCTVSADTWWRGKKEVRECLLVESAHRAAREEVKP